MFMVTAVAPAAAAVARRAAQVVAPARSLIHTRPEMRLQQQQQLKYGRICVCKKGNLKKGQSAEQISV